MKLSAEVPPGWPTGASSATWVVEVLVAPVSSSVV
jgi:hypothetical protein